MPALDGIDPLAHFLIWGCRAYLNPSQFSTAEYYLVYPAARKAGLNPLLHWLEHGRPAGLPISIAEREEKRSGTVPYPIGLDGLEAIELEVMRGTAYLGRYGFTLEKSSSLEHASRAVSDLVARKPRLPITSTSLPKYQLSFRSMASCRSC